MWRDLVIGQSRHENRQRGQQQATTQDNDHEDDSQGSGNGRNNQALENLKSPCKECSGEGREHPVKGSPSSREGRAKAPQAATSLLNKWAKLTPPAAGLSVTLPPIEVTLHLP
ncbi:hypothetical protein EDC04DRAFT_2600230 [Pisolithus marmoratus]|nr:hypothetical protein EDC04DRAFT_2600230 [Pisolithus marmoratus]